MKVSELIEELKKHDPDREVILQKDGEGNGYSPLADLYTAAYTPHTTWYGEVGFEELTEELKAQGFSELDINEGGQKVVVLAPIS